MSKFDLLKIIKHPKTGEFEVDLRNKVKVRGANIQPTMKAFDLMIKKRALKRALKLDKNPTEEEYRVLRQKFEQAVEEKNFRPKNKPVTVRV
jgi:predicted RNA-binding protein YlxR (DUF448 family)